jgi:recombination associated protein RdgC
MKVESMFRTLTPFRILRSEGTRKHLQHPDDHLADNPVPYAPDGKDFRIREPEGGEETTIGFTTLPGSNDYFRNIDGKGHLFAVRLTKRNLPARVVREAAEKMRDQVEQETGRKVGRKEFAGLLDDAKFELLPKAFTSSVVIPVIVRPDDLWVFNGTDKHIDQVIGFLFEFFGCFGIQFTLGHPETKRSLESWMTSMAITGYDDDADFAPTDFAVMRGEESELIRVVNRSLDFQAVQDTIRAGYRVRQIGLLHHSHDVRFRLDEAFKLRQIRMGQESLADLHSNADDQSDDLHAFVWLLITQMEDLLSDLLETIDDGAEDESADDEEW